MFVLSDKKNKLVDVSDVYIKVRETKDEEGTSKDFMLLGVPIGSSNGQILGVYPTYADAQKNLLKLAEVINAYEIGMDEL